MSDQSEIYTNNAYNSNQNDSYEAWFENNNEFPDLTAKKTTHDGWELFEQSDQDNWSEINVSDIHSYATIAKINAEKKIKESKPIKKDFRPIQKPQYHRKEDDDKRDDTFDVDNYDSTTIFYARRELGKEANQSAFLRKKKETEEFEALCRRPVKNCTVCMDH